MNSLTSAAPVLLPLAYLLLVLTYGLLFFRGEGGASRIARPLLWGTILLHLAYLAAITVRWEQFPGANVPQALSVVALAVSIVYALVEAISGERRTGAWLMLLAFLFQLSSSLATGPQPRPVEVFQHPLFALHIFMALLGYAAFVVAGGYGFLFLELYRELKRGRFRLFFGRLPSLEVLDRLMSGALLVGFVALSSAIAAGLAWGLELDTTRWLSDTSVWVTLGTWVLYATTLILRRLGKWQGRHTAVACLVGLGTIVLSLMAYNFLFPTFHG
ncbi:MAG: cytochrome c biogenesis protein CcsA [Acidobacteriota bacterium]